MNCIYLFIISYGFLSNRVIHNYDKLSLNHIILLYYFKKNKIEHEKCYVKCRISNSLMNTIHFEVFTFIK